MCVRVCVCVCLHLCVQQIRLFWKFLKHNPHHVFRFVRTGANHASSLASHHNHFHPCHLSPCRQMVEGFYHWPEEPSPTLTANASGDWKPPPARDLPSPYTAGSGPALRPDHATPHGPSANRDRLLGASCQGSYEDS